MYCMIINHYFRYTLYCNSGVMDARRRVSYRVIDARRLVFFASSECYGSWQKKGNR